MAKSRAVVPAKQDLGTVAAALPTLPVFNAPALAKQIVKLGAQAQRVLEGAQRADISDGPAAAVGADFLKAIGGRIKEVDEERTNVSGDFDKMTKALNALFTKGPIAKLTLAKEILQTKLNAFARVERERAEAAARAEADRIAAEAAAAATQAVEDGDSEGALEILQGAASVALVAKPAEIRGATSVLSTTRRKVGKVTDLRKFLEWLAANKSPEGMAMLGGVSVGQRELNQLAAYVLSPNALNAGFTVPGFTAEYDENVNAR